MRTARDEGTGFGDPGSHGNSPPPGPVRQANPIVLASLVMVAWALVAVGAGAATPSGASSEKRFREATVLARGGDNLGALAIYRELAADGHESGSLYWNWAQVAEARGAVGEAVWALLRGREVEPGDAAAAREIERLRAAANLDPAELSPVPLSGLARFGRRFHLGLVAALLLVVSLAAHVTARVARVWRWPVAACWVTLVLGAAVAAVVWLGALAPPTAVVIRRDVPLADVASSTATVLATMRDGEVVPVLEASGPYLRVQDSSGARGWVLAEDVRRLDQALPHTAH